MSLNVLPRPLFLPVQAYVQPVCTLRTITSTHTPSTPSRLIRKMELKRKQQAQQRQQQQQQQQQQPELERKKVISGRVEGVDGTPGGEALLDPASSTESRQAPPPQSLPSIIQDDYMVSEGSRMNPVYR